MHPVRPVARCRSDTRHVQRYGPNAGCHVTGKTTFPILELALPQAPASGGAFLVAHLPPIARAYSRSDTNRESRYDRDAG